MSRFHVVDEALDAIDVGQLSTEEVLRAAIRLSPEYRAWLRTAVERSQRREPRMPVRMSRRRAPAEDALENVRRLAEEQFRSFPNVCGVSWGVKYRRDLPLSAYSLVVWVKAKPTLEDLDEDQRLPTRFPVNASVKDSFPVDVQVIPQATKQSGSKIRPGRFARVEVEGAGNGTLSCVIEGGLAFFSGHVARLPGKAVHLILGDNTKVPAGKVLKCREDSTCDAAIGGPIPSTYIEFATTDACKIRRLTASDHHIAVSVRTPSGQLDAYVDATNAPAVFGADRMIGLIRLKKSVTVDGDSGSPVFDSFGELVGFVIGASVGKTFVIPAERVLYAFD